MNRAHGSGYRTLISEAMSIIPERLHALTAADILTGTDPLFAGLHRFESASYGRSYRNTAHVAYAFQQPHPARAARTTTVVLPTLPTVETVVHELGHVLHERLHFQPTATPVTRYAETNRWEAFAEAFTSWLIPGYALRPDPRTLALLDSL